MPPFTAFSVVLQTSASQHMKSRDLNMGPVQHRTNWPNTIQDQIQEGVWSGLIPEVQFPTTSQIQIRVRLPKICCFLSRICDIIFKWVFYEIWRTYRPFLAKLKAGKKMGLVCFNWKSETWQECFECSNFSLCKYMSYISEEGKYSMTRGSRKGDPFNSTWKYHFSEFLRLPMINIFQPFSDTPILLGDHRPSKECFYIHFECYHI